MWSIVHSRHGASNDYVVSAIDLLVLSSRRIIIGIGVIFVAWLVIVVGSLAGRITLEIMPVTLVFGLSFCLAYWLLERHLTLAHVVWLAGTILAITLALLQFRLRELALLYALIPMMAAVTIGWPAALCGIAALTLLVGWLASGPGADFVPISYVWLDFFGMLLSGVLGWAANSSLYSTVQWSLDNYGSAQREVEDARAQRLELQQVQQDLLHANKELSRLSDRLTTLTRAAEEARRVKEEFVANVSHELRTPLNMIIGYTQLIINSPGAYGRALPSRLLADIGVIQRNSQHLVELINDVLDLSQVDAGRMAITKQWASVQEIINAAIVAVQPLYQSKGLFLDEQLPAEDLKAFCDSTRIREVVLNLLGNAGRFTDHGGVTVKAHRDDRDQNVVISVQDTGPGISPEGQKKLFEPFQQLDGTVHRTGGSGLGLSISKRFVEMHGGRMWLESEVGVGTTFHFSFPIDPALTESTLRDGAARWLNPYEEYIPRAHASKAPPEKPGPRFVVVEAEDSLQRILGRYLDGADITAVKTVNDGIRELEHSPAQALIVNQLGSQGMNDVPVDASAGGLGMFARLPFNTPVISCWVPGRAEAARRLGVVSYLLKPVQQDALLAVLDGLKSDLNKALTTLTVLIVDDNQETLQLFARMLYANRSDYRVIRALTGREALTLMRERKPDVVLLDMALPDLDGFQVLKEKGADAAISAIPVVVISSTDISGTPVISNALAVSRAGGLSVREFLACIQSITGILAPEPPKFSLTPGLTLDSRSGQAHSESLPVSPVSADAHGHPEIAPTPPAPGSSR